MYKKTLIILNLIFFYILYQNFKSIKQFAQKNYKTRILYTKNETPKLNPELEKYLTTVLNPTDLCRDTTNTSLFVYAVVQVNDFSKRTVIRKTWANKENFPSVKVAFIVGLSSNSQINELVQQEQQHFNDIIQGNFLDSYRNLSYKILTVWKWCIIHCSNVKYIARVQDDMVLNTFNLVKFVQNENLFFPNFDFKNIKYTFICPPHFGAIPIRENISKHYVTHEEYSEKLYNLSSYPTYCSGPGVLMTADLAKELYLKSNDIKVFWIDDIYEALLARHLNPTYINAGSNYINKDQISDKTKDYFLFVRVEFDRNVEQFLSVWNILIDLYKIKN